MSRSRWWAGVVLLVSGAWAGIPPESLAGAALEPDPALGAAGALDERIGVVASLDGRWRAAVRAGDAPGGKSIVIAGGDLSPGPRSVELPDAVRALVFDPAGEALFAAQFRPVRKREGEASLVRIGLPGLELSRGQRIPPSTRALIARVEDGPALLLACDDEIRTLRLPDLRSGLSYRVPGRNSALLALAGDLLLVGQESRVLLVDLSDRPDDHALPVRASAAVASPVDRLFRAAGGDIGARLADGTTWSLTLEPLSLRAAGFEPGPPARTAARDRAVPASETDPTAPAPAAIGGAVGSSVPATGDSGAPGVPIAAAAPPPSGAGPTAPFAAAPPIESTAQAEPQEPSAPAPAAEGALLAASPPDAPAPGAVPAEAAPPPGTASASVAPEEGGPVSGGVVRGRILGVGGRSVSLVLHGPDSVLRESRRLTPDPGGSYRVTGLEPGRYRLTLDAGGSAVAITRPAFAVVDVGAGEVEAETIEVVRYVEP